MISQSRSVDVRLAAGRLFTGGDATISPGDMVKCLQAVVDVMPFLPVIVTPVAALFAALLESLAGCGEGTAARFAHVA